jgi:hypothetical protein
MRFKLAFSPSVHAAKLTPLYSPFKGRCEKIGLVLFDVIPAKAGIQCSHKAPNTLDPGFHRGGKYDFFRTSGRDGE